MNLEEINSAGDKSNPICHVCGSIKTLKLPGGGFLCEKSHWPQRMEFYQREAARLGLPIPVMPQPSKPTPE